MIKSVKRLGAAVLSAVMMLTAVATPLGDNLPAVRDSVSLTAVADSYWVGSSTYGYYANNSTALNEVKAIMSKNCSSSEIARFNKILSEFPLSGYFNSYKTKACTWHCSTCNSWDELIAKGCRSSFYDDETGKTVPCSMTDWNNAIQCAGYAVYCYYRFMGKTTADIITLSQGFTADQLRNVFSDKTIRTGAHFRKSPGHSLCYLTRDDNYIYFIDANSGYNSATGCGSKDSKGHYQTCCKINLHKYTYKEFASACSSGKLTIYNSKVSKFDSISTDDLKKTPSDIGNNFDSVIKCTSTGKVLSAGNDNNVTAVSYNGSNNQLWKFYKNSDNYYEIVNVGTGKRLDVNNAGTADGTNIQVWTDNDSSAQRWGVYGSQGSYLLKPKYSTSSVLDSGGGNNNVHLWTYANNIAAQKFTIEKMPSSWFSNVTAKNIKTNDARITLLANKPASAKATKYSIEVWQTNNTSNKKSYSFTPSGNYPNVGAESKEIYFDMIAEVGFTLNSATQYSYKITQYFTYLGASMSRTSGTYSFTTLASSTHTHSYGSWYTKKAATCTSGGTEERKCSCGATESRSTSSLGHNYGSWSTVTNATCTSGGSEKRTCTRCSASETRSTSALGHNYGGTYYEAVHPHYYGHKCSRCGYSEKTGGNLDYYYLCATCTHLTKPEITKITGDLVDNSEITIEWAASESDKLSHYWINIIDPNGQMIVSVNTEKNNFYTFTPQNTGSYNVTIFATPLGTKNGDGSISNTATIEIGCNHNYDVEVVNPTYDNEGYTLHKCTKCGYSYKDNYKPALKLTELTGVKVKTQGTTSLTLAWDKNVSAKGYILEQYKGGQWTQIAKTGDNATTVYTVNGLKADTTYTFRIKAYVVSGTSEIYGEYTRLAAKTRIENVGSFEGSAVSENAIKLDWNKNDKATGYVIEQYKGGKWTAIATTKNTTTLTFTVKGLAVGSVYKFRMKSYRTVDSKTEFSEYKTITVATLLGSVPDFKVTSVTGSWITLEWSKNDNATGYSIEQYKGGKWTVIATTKNNTTLKFTVKGLNSDTTYTFRIRAYKGASENTVYSDYVRLAGKTRISNVSSFKGTTVSANSVRLDWSKNDVASGYIIEQLKDGKWVQIVVVKSNENIAYTVNDLEKSTSYQFRIKSYRTVDGKTDFSVYANTTVSTAG